jgi:hypothetical protein
MYLLDLLKSDKLTAEERKEIWKELTIEAEKYYEDLRKQGKELGSLDPIKMITDPNSLKNSKLPSWLTSDQAKATAKTKKENDEMAGKMKNSLSLIHSINTETSKLKLTWDDIAVELNDPENWEEMANAFRTVASSFRDIDGALGDTLTKVAELLEEGMSFVKSLASGNYIQAIASVVSMAVNIYGDLLGDQHKRIDNSKAVETAIQAENDALQRQLDLLKDIKGEDRVIGYEAQIADIEKTLNAAANKGLTMFGNERYYSDRFKDNPTLGNEDFLDYLHQVLAKAERSVAYAEGRGQKVDPKLKEQILYLQQAIDLYEQRNELIKTMYAELTGTTYDSVLDGIVDAFKDGTMSAEEFAANFGDMINQALTENFKAKFLEEQVSKWYDSFGEAAKDGLTEDEILGLRASYQGIVDQANADWAAYQAIIAATGVGADDTSSKVNNMAGAIKGITEDTAGLIAGQFNGMRMNMVDMVNISTKQLVTLNAIEVNTRKIDTACRYLASIESSLNSSRAYGQ